MMKEIWEYQIRLQKIQGKKPFQLIEHPRFRAAYDFLLLREQAGEDLDGLGSWWTNFQIKNPAPIHHKSKRPVRGNGQTKPPQRRRRN